MTSIKTSQVTDALKFWVTSTGIFDVDDAGYVIDLATENRKLISDGKDNHPIILYQEKITDTDALILNPFAEGLTTTPTWQWFYAVQRVTLAGKILETVLSAIHTAIKEKAKTPAERKKNPEHLPMEFLSLVSTIIDDADDKLAEEFTQLYKTKESIHDLADIFYSRRELRCTFTCALLQRPTWREKYPNIRKKSWTLFEKLFKHLYNIKDETELSKFGAKVIPGAAPRFSSTMATLFAIYSEINTLVNQATGDAIDLTTFSEHLDLMPEYTQNAKFMMTSSVVETKPTLVSTNNNQSMPFGNQSPIPTDPSGIPIGIIRAPGEGPVSIPGSPQNFLPQPQYQPQQQFFQPQPAFNPTMPAGFAPAFNFPQPQPSYGSGQSFGSNTPPWGSPALPAGFGSAPGQPRYRF